MARKKASKTTTVVTKSVTSAARQNNQPRAQPRPSKPRKSKKNSGARKALSLCTRFECALLYPDIIGPIRYPRLGGSDRTLLGMDVTIASHFGNLTNTVYGMQMRGTYNGTGFAAIPFKATDAVSTLVAETALAPSLQFPPAANLRAVNLTAGCLKISYLGKPLEAQGQLIIGTAAEIISSSTSYSSLRLLPGTVTIPVTRLLEEDFRIPLRHMDSMSWGFSSLTGQNGFFDFPFCFVSGLAEGSVVEFSVIRTWECTPQPNLMTAAVPYLVSSDSHVYDSNALQDAAARIGQMLSPLTEGLPAYLQDVGVRMINHMGGAASTTAGVLLAGRVSNHINRLSNGDNGGRMHLEM